MPVSSFKFVLLLSITNFMQQSITCDEIQWEGSAVAFGTPELYALIANNSATVQLFFQNQLRQQNEHHHEIKELLQSQIETLTRVADTQTQLTNAFGQVVTLLQMQSQELKDMSTGVNTVVSVLEDQQETLKNISRSLPVVLEQQANQIELLSQCQPRPDCSGVDSNRLQTMSSAIIATNPTTMTSTEHVTQDTTTLRSVELPIHPPIHDCSELVMNGHYPYGHYPSGVYTITPTNDTSFDTYCDMDTANGGWTVFQKRFNGSVNFYRGWDDYDQGFGSLDGEFWLGLGKIHQLTQSGRWALRVDLEDFDGNTSYAVYNSFQIGDAESNYTLSIGSYQGTAADTLLYNSNKQFSTYNRDNDLYSQGVNCAIGKHGAWWYGACSNANLNGKYWGPSDTNGYNGMCWQSWKNPNPSLKKSEMKIRRVQ